MNALLWIVRKDLWRFFADRQGALMTVLVPVVLASLLGTVFAPKAGGTVVSLVVVDQDRGPAARKLVARIKASPSFEVTEVDAATARRKLAAGDAPVALFLPKGTSAALRPAALFSSQRGHADLRYDPSRAVEANLAEGLLTRLLMEQVGEMLGSGLNRRQMFRDLLGQLDRDAGDVPAGQRAALRSFLQAGLALDAPAAAAPKDGDLGSALRPPLVLHKRVAARPRAGRSGYNSYSHNFAGMLLMFLLFAGQSAAKQLVAERGQGTLGRLRMAPLPRWHLLAGTGVSTTIIALLATAVVYGVGMAAFGVRVTGSWPGFLLILVCQALFVGGFALLLAGLGRTEAQIGALGTFAVLVLSFLGGAMFPSFLMPGWLQTVSQALPTYWATRGLAAMTWRGLPMTEALLPAGVLLASALACAVLGIRRFRWS